jgi:sporulation protein YlmC with PRC-barrel domain
MKVLTEEGRLLGAVSDVLLDELTGAVEQYEISGGHLRDLLSGRIYLSSAAPRALGDEFMVVPETAMASEPAQLREGPPLVVEAPPWIGTEVRPTQVEQAMVGASGAESPEMLAARRGAARSLWDQVGERVGWLTGRR